MVARAWKMFLSLFHGRFGTTPSKTPMQPSQPTNERALANSRYMSLETAVWLAADIMPLHNIDIAAKRLAVEVSILEREAGKEPTKGRIQ